MGLDHWLTRGTLDNEREVLVTWRKENWLHNWFLTHCAPRRDPDDQSPIPVRKADVEELRNTIKRVLKYAKKFMGDKLKELDYRTEEDTEGHRELRKKTEDELKLEKYCDAHLPAQCGCFFGSTEYDHWYFEALEQELMQLNGVLEYWDDTKQYWYECWW